MLLMFVFCGLGLLGLVPVAHAERQDHHAATERGAMVMGFDQARTAHHFSLFADGGTIEVSIKDSDDRKNRDAIRSHLAHIATMFGNGDFDAPMLVHDSNAVPGTAVMRIRKDAIRYRYAETPAGGRINIVTTDTEALTAVHAFLAYQIAEHKTGDSAAVQAR